jgi:hypothetical protein
MVLSVLYGVSEQNQKVSLSFESTGNGQPKPLNAKIHLKIHILFSSTHMGSETAKL